MHMKVAEHVAATAHNGEAFARAAQQDGLETPVQTCPDP